jgi:Kef-type K+ transport system membrane component KefB
MISGGIMELAIIICLASFLGVIARMLKQPLVLAFILTGIIIGLIQKQLDVFSIGNQDVFHLFSELGIMFLLFLIGLEMNYTSLKTVGKTSAMVGLGQILFTFIFGFIISYFLLGFAQIHAIYIAISLTFSSTIIIVKLLSDKKALNSLYGKISIGFLLVQDFVVILMLIALTGIDSSGEIVASQLFLTFLLGIVFFSLMVYLGRSVFPWIFDKIAKSQELLFLISLAWVFGLVGLVKILKEYTGVSFSIEVAGFLAGIALANSSENHQIASRIKPLRDFFILIFFVILGSSIIFYNFNELAVPIIILSLFVLIGNPLIVMIIMGLFMKHKKRTSFLSGITVAQISEFSLILAALGLKLGHITEEIVAVVAAVGIITITVSTYMVINSEKIFIKMSSFLSIFERKKTNHEISFDVPKKPIILIGYDRAGRSIALNIPKEKLLIIDFNPDIINELKENGYDSLYADIIDPLIFENIDFQKAEIIISTSPNIEDNLSLISSIKLLSEKPKVILRAETKEEAEILYKNNADYVFIPLFSSGQYLGKIINLDPKLENIHELKEKDLIFMEKISNYRK